MDIYIVHFGVLPPTVANILLILHWAISSGPPYGTVYSFYV